MEFGAQKRGPLGQKRELRTLIPRLDGRKVDARGRNDRVRDGGVHRAKDTTRPGPGELALVALTGE